MMNLTCQTDGPLLPPIELPSGKFDPGLIKESLTRRIARPPIHPIYVCYSVPRFTLAEARGLYMRARVYTYVHLVYPGARHVCVCVHKYRACMYKCVRAYMGICVYVCARARHTTRETDDRAPLTPEPHTGVGLGAREWLWRAEG